MGSGTIVDNSTQSSVADCQATCQANEFCCAFNYEYFSDSCLLFGDDFVKGGPPVVISPKVANIVYATATVDCGDLTAC